MTTDEALKALDHVMMNETNKSIIQYHALKIFILEAARFRKAVEDKLRGAKALRKMEEERAGDFRFMQYDKLITALEDLLGGGKE